MLPASIPKYLTILRVMHLGIGLPDPEVLQMYDVKPVLTGLGKDTGIATKQMKAITPLLLLCLHNYVDFTSLGDLSMWAACLVLSECCSGPTCFPHL